MWLKTEFQGHVVLSQPPTFGGFQALESPNETPRPSYKWSLGGAGGQRSPRTVGGQRWVYLGPRGKKNIFSKVVPKSLGMLKQASLARFEPVVARFGPGKIPKCLVNGLFSDQNRVKNGSKMGQKRIFPKVIMDHLGCSNKAF